MGFPRSISARPSVKRALASAVATIGLAVPAGLSAIPTMAANPIELVSSSSWRESPTGTTQLHIVGQVKNNTSGNVRVESGADGNVVTEAGPGDLVHIDPGTVHPETYSGKMKVVGFGIGSGPGVVKVPDAGSPS